MEEHNIFDRVLKVLIRDYADSFLDLVLPGIPIRVIGRLENVALAIPEKLVDFVHRVMYEEQEYLLHIEFQTEHRTDVPKRLFIYSALLTQQFGLPVLTVVLYLKQQKSLLPTAYETQVGGVLVNRFQYIVVKLWDYTDEIAAGRRPELVPLLTMLIPDPGPDVLARERELILEEQDAQKRADLLACAVTIGSRYFDKEFLWRFFREEVEMLREASFIQDWLDEQLKDGLQQGLQQGIQQGIQQGLQQGLQQGIQQGLQQGLQQGIQQGAQAERRTLIVHILRHRFGDVPLDLETRLGLLPADRLTLLVDTALEAPDLPTFAEQMDRLFADQFVPA